MPSDMLHGLTSIRVRLGGPDLVCRVPSALAGERMRTAWEELTSSRHPQAAWTAQRPAIAIEQM